MANPQAEDGHVDIANEIIEALSRVNLSSAEWRCLMVIFRKTYGFHKREDWISLSQFCLMTGIRKQNICRSLSKLITKNIIIKTDNDKGVSYRIQKDFDRWKSLSKQITLSKLITTVINSDNESLSKLRPTKENNTKENITKEILCPLPLPDQSQKPKEKIPYEEIISYLNHKSNKSFKPDVPKTKSLIRARWNEGFRLDDFKKVIDGRVEKWIADEKMSEYLRPKTLFAGDKFESYLQDPKISWHEKVRRAE